METYGAGRCATKIRRNILEAPGDRETWKAFRNWVPERLLVRLNEGEDILGGIVLREDVREVMRE